MRWTTLDESTEQLNYWNNRTETFWRPTNREDTEDFIREARDLDCLIHCKNRRLSIVSKQNKKVLTWALGDGRLNNESELFCEDKSTTEFDFTFKNDVFSVFKIIDGT